MNDFSEDFLFEKSTIAQNWDAVGVIHYQDHVEWLLVEAKAHVGELESACKARSAASLAKIRAALEKASRAFCSHPPAVENWLEPYYQYANRLAVLYFLMAECAPAAPARLLTIYFCGEQRENLVCPQSEAEWQPALQQVKAHLDEGNMWAASFALVELTPAEEAKIRALVQKAVS